VQGDDFLLYRHGMLRRVVSGFPIVWTDRPQGITVLFADGYPADAVPPVFRAVTLDYAGKMLSNPALVPHSRTVGRVSVSYSDMRAMVPPIDDSRLDTYRLPEGF
ncbi:hypothetical protein, partial [Streptomyces sp. DH37]|uniref:hypothetical protein n=1 Tax=Streptomyces sp. DH37 TaxID=3040122 RepID=UPI0024412BB9